MITGHPPAPDERPALRAGSRCVPIRGRRRPSCRRTRCWPGRRSPTRLCRRPASPGIVSQSIYVSGERLPVWLQPFSVGCHFPAACPPNPAKSGQTPVSWSIRFPPNSIDPTAAVIIAETGCGFHDCNFRIPAPCYGHFCSFRRQFPYFVRRYCVLYLVFFRYSIGEQP